VLCYTLTYLFWQQIQKPFQNIINYSAILPGA
jgi:hypothetical protein